MSPGPHDIVEVTNLSHQGVALTCACGRHIVGTSKDKATAAHDTHWGLEAARVALEGADDGS